MSTPINPVTGLPMYEPLQQVHKTQKSDKDETPIGSGQQRKQRRQHEQAEDDQPVDQLELSLQTESAEPAMRPAHEPVPDMPDEPGHIDVTG